MRNRYREHSAVYHYARKIEGSGGEKGSERERRTKKREKSCKVLSDLGTHAIKRSAIFFAISSLFSTVPSRSAFCHYSVSFGFCLIRIHLTRYLSQRSILRFIVSPMEEKPTDLPNFYLAVAFYIEFV